MVVFEQAWLASLLENHHIKVASDSSGPAKATEWTSSKDVEEHLSLASSEQDGFTITLSQDTADDKILVVDRDNQNRLGLHKPRDPRLHYRAPLDWSRSCTEEEERAIEDFAAKRDAKTMKEIVLQSEGLLVKRESMWRILNSEWLNDEVINFFFRSLEKRDDEWCQDVRGKKRSVFFNTHFIAALMQEDSDNKNERGVPNHERVKNWPRLDIFECEKIFIPVHVDRIHWTLIVVFVEAKKIRYYDSMFNGSGRYLDGIMTWLKAEHLEKKGQLLPDIGGFQLEIVNDCPQQSNSVDCGVFVCAYADFLSQDLPIDFAVAGIANHGRKRMALSLIHEKSGLFFD